MDEAELLADAHTSTEAILSSKRSRCVTAPL
jgi:hypothetical protein